MAYGKINTKERVLTLWHSTQRRLEREEQILLSLKKLDYLTRSQIQIIHGLGKDRNATRVLKNMEEYVNRFRDGENIYYLSAEGRKRVGATKARRKSEEAHYIIKRNYVYIHYGCPESWESEVKIGGVIADATFTANDRLYIVDVDRPVQMSNLEKTKEYKEMVNNGEFDKPPMFIWVTITDYKKEQLEEALQGLDHVVYLLDDLKE